MSSGSSRADSAVEPTRSQNMTVSWRRSAESALAGAADGAFSASIADINLRRCPTAATPRSLRSSSVSFGSTSPPIALSRNAASYCPRPSSCSHLPTSIRASDLRPHDGLTRPRCPCFGRPVGFAASPRCWLLGSLAGAPSGAVVSARSGPGPDALPRRAGGRRAEGRREKRFQLRKNGNIGMIPSWEIDTTRESFQLPARRPLLQQRQAASKKNARGRAQPIDNTHFGRENPRESEINPSAPVPAIRGAFGHARGALRKSKSPLAPGRALEGRGADYPRRCGQVRSRLSVSTACAAVGLSASDPRLVKARSSSIIFGVQ